VKLVQADVKYLSYSGVDEMKPRMAKSDFPMKTITYGCPVHIK
jgi:hypothetical protein